MNSCMPIFWLPYSALQHTDYTRAGDRVGCNPDRKVARLVLQWAVEMSRVPVSNALSVPRHQILSVPHIDTRRHGRRWCRPFRFPQFPAEPRRRRTDSCSGATAATVGRDADNDADSDSRARDTTPPRRSRLDAVRTGWKSGSSLRCCLSVDECTRWIM